MFGQRNQLFDNEGGEGELAEVSRGAAFGDIDNDGDIDIVVSNNNGPARLLLNEAARGAHWLEVRLEGVGVNRQGIGARVGVFSKGAKPVWRRAHSDGSYCSARPASVHFGLGREAKLEAAEVLWPDGSRERWTDVGPDRRVTLRQGTGKPIQ